MLKIKVWQKYVMGTTIPTTENEGHIEFETLSCGDSKCLISRQAVKSLPFNRENRRFESYLVSKNFCVVEEWKFTCAEYLGRSQILAIKIVYI